ncbi:MAG: sialidase family protein, partial [Acidimicrobiales bacterium]
MTRRWLVAAALLAVLAGVLGYVGLRPRPLVAGPNVFVNPAGIIDAFSTPTLVRDPVHAGDLVAVYRQDRPRFSAHLAWSADAGATWHSFTLPLPAGDHEAFFPDAAFAPDGELYVAYVDLAGRGNVPADLWLAHSTDGGQHLSAPARVAGAHAFQPRIVVGPDGVIHLTWLQVRSATAARLRGAPVQIVTASSTDRGATFTPVVAVSPAGDWVSSPATAVGPGGRLVVAYEDLGPGPPDNRQTDRYALVVSRGEGSGFSAPVTVSANVVGHQSVDLFDNLFPSLAAAPGGPGGTGDPGGNLYLAWSNRSRPGQVLLARSADGGARWSSATSVDIPAGGAGGVSQYLPSVAIAPNGHVDVAFLEEHADHFTDVYLATSTDQGASFNVIRMSSASFDGRVGPTFGGGLPADLGSHLGLISGDSTVHVAWADTRLGTSATGREDIVTAAATTLGTTLARTELGVAAVAALLALLALAGAVVLRVRSRR